MKNSKHEIRNSKWFDRFDKLTAGKLTTLPALLVLSGIEGSRVEASNIEGQIRNSNDRITKTTADVISGKRQLF